MHTNRNLPIITLAFALFAITAQAEEPLPHVQVSVRATGKVFKNFVSDDIVPEILHSLAAHFASVAQQASPCMDWGADTVDPVSPNAKVILVFSKDTWGKSFIIHLTYRLIIGGNPEQPLKIPAIEILNPLEESTPPAGFDNLLKFLSDKISTEFASDLELLNAEIIRKIPIASAIELEEYGRIVVPVDAGRLRLADNSMLFIDLRGKVCTSKPDDCEVSLRFLGLSSNRLRCKPEGSNCCGNLSWDSVQKIKGIADKYVFLGPHQHCSFFQHSCRGDGVSLSKGFVQTRSSP